MVILFFVLAMSTLFGGESLTDMAMTPRDRESIGVDRLSAQQKKALDAWLEKWTQTTITHAHSYHPSLTLTQWISLWRQEAQQQRILEEESPDSATHTIFRNKNGKALELADGSLWDIVVFDEFMVSMWKRGHKVTVNTNKNDLRRPYSLTNISRNEVAGAKLQRKASPDGKRPPDPPNYFAHSHNIESIGVNGETVTLANTKVWKIAPLDQQRVLHNWKELDRIRVTKSNDVLYPVKLENLDSGDDASAK